MTSNKQHPTSIGRSDVTVLEGVESFPLIADLGNSEAMFNALAKVSRMLIWRVDAKGLYQQISDVSDEILGHRAEDLIGKVYFYDLCPGFDRDRVRHEVTSLLERGKAFREFEHCVESKDHKIIWLLSSAIPLTDSSGTVVAFQGWSLDITERMAASEKVRILSERLMLAKRASAIGIWDWNLLTGELHWDVEMCRMFGIDYGSISPAELSRFFMHSLHVDDRERVEREVDRAVIEGDFCTNFRIQRRDGAVRHLGANAIVEYSDDGMAQRMVGTNWDITEAKEMELNFLRAQRMEGIGTLAGGLAHNLNNILSPILISTEMLKANLKNEKEIEQLATIERCICNGAGIIQQILSFARGIDGQRSELDVYNVLSVFIQIIRKTFPSKIAIEFEAQEDVGRILGDANQLEQVLMNICLNARDAMPDGGKLTVKAFKSLAKNADGDGGLPVGLDPDYEFNPNCIVIAISDTGCGMSEDVIRRIFDPFFSTKQVGKGTGLGLAASLGIIKSFGGIIRVESQLNQGSTFYVQLPLFGRRSLTSRTNEMPVLSEQRQAVFIVGEDISLVDRLERIFLQFAFEVHFVESVENIAQLVRDHNFRTRLVIFDGNVAAKEVETMVSTLRILQRRSPGLICLIEYGLDAPRLDTISVGHLYYLVRPFEERALRSLVASAIGETLSVPIRSIPYAKN